MREASVCLKIKAFDRCLSWERRRHKCRWKAALSRCKCKCAYAEKFIGRGICCFFHWLTWHFVTHGKSQPSGQPPFACSCGWVAHSPPHAEDGTDGRTGRREEAQTQRGNVKGQFQKERKMLLLLSHTFGKLQLRLWLVLCFTILSSTRGQLSIFSSPFCNKLAMHAA